MLKAMCPVHPRPILMPTRQQDQSWPLALRWAVCGLLCAPGLGLLAQQHSAPAQPPALQSPVAPPTAPAQPASVVTSATKPASNKQPPTLLTRPAAVPTPTTPAAQTAQPPAPPALTTTLPAGQPLRVQIDHRYGMKRGAPVAGFLIDPVYTTDHLLLPAHTRVTGSISRLRPVRRSTRVWALLNADFTPLKTPELALDSLVLPNGQRLAIAANASERTVGLVRMTAKPKKKPSLWKRFTTFVHSKAISAKNSVHSQHKAEYALRFLYGQLPYHPQEIWTGTQFDAVLAAPITLADPKAATPLPITPPNGHIPAGTIEAVLTTSISSATSKQGTPVEAVLTQPYMDAAQKQVLLPTGTRLLGVVQQAQPARKFGRNGKLRFTFRQVQLPTGALERVHGQMTSVEGKKGQNVTVDQEGGAQANSDKGKFLAPLALGLMAGNSLDADQNAFHAGAASNGLGLVVRTVSLLVLTPTVTATIAYYALAQSVTKRWLMPGHQVAFPKNTRLELGISDR